jgi:hypothetical protein
MNYGVVLFRTTAMAMKAEKTLSREGYGITLIPTPRQLSSDCGIALRFVWSQNEAIKLVLEKAGVEIQGIHELK